MGHQIGPQTLFQVTVNVNKLQPKTKKMKLASDEVFEIIPNAHPDLMGENVEMKFSVEDGPEEWFTGIITTYNCMSGKYGIYFPYDGQTVDTTLDDEDLRLLLD